VAFVLLNQFVYSVQDVVLIARHVSRLSLSVSPDASAILYQAGQYIKVIHQNNEESPLSIASAPVNPRSIELHLSHAPKNQQAHDILAMADAKHALILSGAYGACTVSRLLLDRPILFFVRGTGFAPVKAVLEEMTALTNCPPIHLYWGVASPDDFYLPELISGWEKYFANFRFTPMVSRSADQHQLHHAVLKDYPDLSLLQVYASGGEEMVFSAFEIFQQHGLPKARFYSDML
jgi:CDP-4-dehydro-6-deoxyglucose reductase